MRFWKRTFRRECMVLLALFYCASAPLYAAPHFYISGSSSMIKGYSYQYQVYLYTDGTPITAAQTVLHFDSSKISNVSASNLGSRCNFWAPADPALNMGTTSTPYFHDNNKFVLACGFSNPGYTSSSSDGDLIANLTVSVNATLSATSTSRLQFSNTLFRYIGQTVSPGTNEVLDLTVFSSTSAANPSATPYPSATPVNPRTITADDLNFLNISSGSGSTSTTGNASTLLITLAPSSENTISLLDNTIPAPPELSPRPTITPFLGSDENSEDENLSLGEVLSVQSLRELLLPGKSSADKRVVLVNLLSTIAFLIILTVLIWRLIMISRMNKIKNKHLNEILHGELSALESKLAADLPGEGKSMLTSRMEELKVELDKDLK